MLPSGKFWIRHWFLPRKGDVFFGGMGNGGGAGDLFFCVSVSTITSGVIAVREWGERRV